MRLASSRLRLAQPSSLSSSSLVCGIATAPPFSPACDGCPDNRKARWQSFRAYATSASAAAPRPQSPTGDKTEGGRAEDPGAVEQTLSLQPKPYFSYLKRRGPFLPARIADDGGLSAADASSDRWGMTLRAGGQRMLGAEHYGKWRALVFDYDRLMFESGLLPAALSGRKSQRSVDRPEHAADIGLWSAIFNFAQRQGDGSGALVVWREIFERKQLHSVDGIVARAFWQSVAEAALLAADDGFLESTWAYAEWMYDTHGVVWPGYYRTVVAGCLDQDEHDRALRWHLRLSAHFALPKRDFFDMLKGYLTDPDPALQETLRSIYVTGRHRALYDTVVPLLWSRGHSTLARAWRETLVRHDDRPTSAACRPFLQYLAGYYPETVLCPEEQRIANARPAQILAPAAAPAEAPAPADLPTNLFHLVNRVHGETFGIQEKSFNDRIGSKWFATSWVSLDTAINLVYSLGIAEIGPLSLQSIALRAGGTPAGVVRRLEQLQQCQISIGRANYSKAIRHLAQTGDAETLSELLQSTLHPDVFDDIVLQRYVVGSASFTGDWKTHRLVLAVRLAVSEDALVTASNRLLLACLHQKKKATALKLLDEFAARGIELLPATCESMSRLILADVPRRFDPNAAPDVDFYGAVCRRLAALRLPVAAEAWQNILLILGRQGRLAELEKVALDIVDQFVALQTGTPLLPRPTPAAAAAALKPSPSSSPSSSLSDETSAFKVHVADVPDIVRGSARPDEDDLGYRLLPRDLPLNHPLHPLSLIFSQSLVESTVRWYFHRKGAYRQSNSGLKAKQSKTKTKTKTKAGATATQPRDFAQAGGIRLLAMLRRRGVAIPAARVRSEALVCIAAVFGPESMATRHWQPARSMNQLTLGEVKALCDAAWAGGPAAAEADAELLPPLPVLETALEAIKPVASTFGRQITRPGDKARASRAAFMDAVAHQS